MVIIENKQIYSSNDKYIHRINTESYFKKAIALSSDTVSDFEEIDELPKYTKEEYSKKVEELIALKYSNGQEIQFAREKESAGEAYTKYLEYIEECKIKAKAELSN